jgi:hypothetical protein
MANFDLKLCAEYSAYTIVILVTFFKVFISCYTYIKDFFLKNKNQLDDKSNINISVNTNQPSQSLLQRELREDDRYFLYFLLEQNKIISAIHNMKVDILREQMEYYTKHSKNIKMFAIEIIIKLLEEAGISDTSFGTYFSNFENFIEVCENRCETLFRQMCKDNHFSSKSNQEFKELVIKNTVIFEGTVNDLLRRRYPQKEYIKNFDRMYLLCDKLRDAIKDSFEYAKDIAEEKEFKVSNAKIHFENQISELIGIKYNLDI